MGECLSGLPHTGVPEIVQPTQAFPHSSNKINVALTPINFLPCCTNDQFDWLKG